MKKTLIFILIFGIVSIIQAQEPNDWHDPTTIFVDGNAWQLVEEEPNRIYPYNIDNLQRIIQVYEESTATWHEYPFPDDVDALFSPIRLSDNIVQVELNSTTMRQPRPHEVLWLNLDTGTYETPPTVCEGQVIQNHPASAEHMGRCLCR